MKKIILILGAILALGYYSSARDIKDYFYRIGYNYPDGGYFYASRDACFYSYILKGAMEEYEEWGLDEGQYALTWKYQVRERSGQRWSTISMAEHILDYSSEVVTSTYQTYYNQFAPKGNYQHDKLILLAFPDAKGPRKWQETKTGDKYNCSAQWAYVSDGGSFLEAVIKVSKTLISSGITETSYWAKYYGKIWETWNEKGKEPFTVKQRRGVNKVKEISEKEFLEVSERMAIEAAKNAFIDNHKGEVHSLAEDATALYKELGDSYARYLVNILYKDEFIYNTGYYSSSQYDMKKWVNASVDWRSYALVYRDVVSIDDNGCHCEAPVICRVLNGQKTRITEYDRPSMNWAAQIVRQRMNDGTFERPSAVEPVSGYRLFFKTVDQFEHKLDIDSYRLKIKKKKGSFLLTKGNESVWFVCEKALIPYLESMYAQNGKSSIAVRLIRFSTDRYERYALITDCDVYQAAERYMSCKLVTLVMKE